jgi:hypothetical protein
MRNVLRISVIVVTLPLATMEGLAGSLRRVAQQLPVPAQPETVAPQNVPSVPNSPAAPRAPTPEEYIARVGGNAKLVAAGELKIDGQRVLCGRRPAVLDPGLDDYAAAYPGFIILNPTLIAKVSTPVKQWIYAHSCGYQFRGPDPKIADCFAVQRGRRQGWLTPEGLEEVCKFISPAAGSKVHPEGPKRCELMRECFKDPVIR